MKFENEARRREAYDLLREILSRTRISFDLEEIKKRRQKKELIAIDDWAKQGIVSFKE